MLSAQSQRIVSLQSAVYIVTSGERLTETVVLDSTLGRNTAFTFDLTSGSITPTVTSPSGVIYGVASAIVTYDQLLNTYVFNVPVANFEVGVWTYTVTSRSNDVTVSVTVTSMLAASATATYVTNCYWSLSDVASLSPQLTSVPQIVAIVQLGKCFA